MEVKHISKAEFIQHLHDVDTDPKGWSARHTLPVLIDFYATWCGPCQALAPLLEQVAKEYEGRILVYKIDVDKEPELTALYNIRTVPTLLLARPEDKQPQLMLGVMGKAELSNKIESLLLG